MAIQAVVTDIEGTTSDIRFVKQVLFPFARAALPSFIAEHGQQPEVRAWLQSVADETGIDADDHAALVHRLQGWIDEDRKHTALKALQGMIWAQGYQGAAFQAHVYPDAVAGLRRWHQRGLPLYVYSSGSVPAQKLFFGHSEAGDLRPLFSGYFDTTTGPKQAPEAYQRIAEALAFVPEEILFLSDIAEELDAAASVGFATAWLIRQGDRSADSPHPIHSSFDSILP